MKNTLLFKILISIILGLVLYFFVTPYFFGGSNVEYKIRLRTKNYDKYIFYYQNSLAFEDLKSQTKELTQTSEWQILKFEIPYSNDLVHIRLDFGDKKSVDSIIEIDYMSISYNGSSLKIFKDDIPELFDFNGCTYDPSSGILKTYTIHNAHKHYDPFIYSRPIRYLLHDFSESFSYKSLITSILLALALFVHLFLNGQPKSPSINGNKIHVTLFFLFLLSPSIYSFFVKDEGMKQENKASASFPTFDFGNWEVYPKHVENYLSENFGLRKFFVETNASFRYLFASTIKPDKILIGKQGWFFHYEALNPQDDGIHDITHTNLLEENSMNAYVTDLESRTKVLRELSIGYYKLVGPNAGTIYPEFLPDRIKWSTPQAQSRLDQFKKCIIKKKADVNLIDVRSVLMHQKKQHLLYKKTDSHWNNVAGYFAYKEFILEASHSYPALIPRDMNEYSIEEVNGIPSLAISASIMDQKETIPILKLKTSEIRGMTDEMLYARRSGVTECDSAVSDKTLLMFRDSFGHDLIPFLSTHFKKCIYIWSDYNADSVLKYRPDIVLECYVERRFLR